MGMKMFASALLVLVLLIVNRLQVVHCQDGSETGAGNLGLGEGEMGPFSGGNGLNSSNSGMSNGENGLNSSKSVADVSHEKMPKPSGNGASGIECYYCTGSECKDQFSKIANGTCTAKGGQPATHCLTTVFKGGNVTRTCGTGNTCNSTKSTYCCDSNLCNVGNTVTTSFVAMGVALVAAFIFSRQ